MSTHGSTPHDTPEFSITRTFHAPRDLVWRAWTVESELAKWLRPFGVSTDSVSFDVQVGGRYRYTMTNDETGEVFPTGGEFLEVTRRTASSSRGASRILPSTSHPSSP